MPAKKKQDKEPEDCVILWTVSETLHLLRKKNKGVSVVGKIVGCSFIIQKPLPNELARESTFLFDLESGGLEYGLVSNYKGAQSWNAAHTVLKTFTDCVALRPQTKIPQKLLGKNFCSPNFSPKFFLPFFQPFVKIISPDPLIYS